MSFHWHSMLTYSDYCSATLGGTGGLPSIQNGPVTSRRFLPSQASLIREQRSWNGFDHIVLHLLSPRTISPCFPCHSAATESTFPLFTCLKPAKSTELSRSDGHGQNSIWCALFVDCVRLVAEGTRRGAYHAETEWAPPPSNTLRHCQIMRNWRFPQLV